MKVTAESYRLAALDHVGAARELLEQQNYALSNYIAGLAVECIFRAYAARYDRAFDCRHNLNAWYEAARFDRIVPFSRQEEIAVTLGIVVTHWTNSQRYYSKKFLRSHFKQAQLDRGIRGDFVKELTRRTVDAAFVLITLGDTQWKRSFKK